MGFTSKFEGIQDKLEWKNGELLIHDLGGVEVRRLLGLDPLERALQITGGYSDLAKHLTDRNGEALGRRVPKVWEHRQQVPPHYWFQIENATKQLVLGEEFAIYNANASFGGTYDYVLSQRTPKAKGQT